MKNLHKTTNDGDDSWKELKHAYNAMKNKTDEVLCPVLDNSLTKIKIDDVVKPIKPREAATPRIRAILFW